MDLRRRSCLWFVNVVLLLIISLNGAVMSENMTERTCSPGLKTPGYTVPQGDIVIEYGKSLDLVCVLYDSALQKFGPNPSQDLMYVRNDAIIPKEKIEILNSTSIRLHIDKPPKVTTDSYTCMFRNRSVCMNVVTVGSKPQPVDDFECIGYNYDNLTCSWTPALNYVKTTYNLTFTLRGRASRFIPNRCPTMKYPTVDNPKMSCFWNISTTPQYRQAHKEFYFTLTMTNNFGMIQLNRTFKHFQHVLPEPPENLTFIDRTPSSIYLTWVVPYMMQSFPPGVHHRVLYQCEYGEKVWHFAGLITNEPKAPRVRFNLTDLKYAHALCDIRVSIRSADALADDESMWSRNASITVRTSSKVPDRPPRTSIGSFEVVAFGNNLQYREAYIYWQQINDEERNGPEFKYYINVEGNASMQPIELTNTYAKFKNLRISRNYQFNIWSRNSAGLSAEKSIVYIPNQSERIPEPLSFTKVEFGDGKYELTWEPPKLLESQTIDSYTIFWCNNDRDRPYQCTGKLNWREVAGDITVHNETVARNQIYQFAISANGPKTTSGMLWAACTVIHNKSMGKMKNVWINRLGSTFIEVGWKLECSDRIGSVEGFIIYYCPILSPAQKECKGPQKNVTFYGDSGIMGGNVTNLTPYTTYMLTVAVITKHTTFSQQSDPLFNTTTEAAPSTPPLDVRVTNVTNSSISLAWLPPKVLNGIVKYYIVTYNNATMKIDPNTKLTLTNLSSFETYQISLEACTTDCSNKSEVSVTTSMGYPGKIRQPTVTFQNDSYITILWDKPNEPRGRTDYYEVQIKQKRQSENKTIPIFRVTDRKYNIENCGENGKFNSFYIAVRAVNLIGDVPYSGPWSDELESYCRMPTNYLYIIIPIGILGVILFLSYGLHRVYRQCKVMQDVEVKLPPGLAPAITDHTLVPWNTEKRQQEDRDLSSPPDEELLLVKLSEGRQSIGESSGCSSGHESVTSSLQSGTRLSNTSDSGTEQPENYCVLGVDSLSEAVSAVAAAAAAATTTTTKAKASPSPPPMMTTTTNSSYVTVDCPVLPPAPLPSEQGETECVVATENLVSDNSAYVLTGNVVKTLNPGYVPFNQEPVDKGAAYVIAGAKNNGYIAFNPTTNMVI